MLKKHLSVKNLLLLLYFVLLLSDIFFVHRLSDLMTLIMIALWFANVIILKLEHYSSLRLAIICLLMAFFSRFFGNFMVVEKAISWFAIFLIFALIHSYLKLSGNAQNK